MTANRLLIAASRLAVACISASVAIAAPAAPCRSETAATSGSTAGYTQDTQAADAIEQQDKSASDILGQCVAGITGVITIPTFPSLDDILNQIKNEVCRIASEQVHQAAGNVASAINAALSGIPNSGGPITVPSPSISIGTSGSITIPATVSPAPTSSSPPSWWSRIWR
jgi:hypothetical protein